MQGAMPDNLNPTVHLTAAPSHRPRRRARSSDDLDDDAAWQQPATVAAMDVDRHGGPNGVSADDDEDDGEVEPIDEEEVFDLLRGISDPEHPLTLEQLAVVTAAQITVTNGKRPHVLVEFTPTIPHCSMATLIGLSIRVRLLRALPERYKVDIRIRKGTHQSENSVNKQLNDKERVAAALENQHLLGVVQQCLSTSDAALLET